MCIQCYLFIFEKEKHQYQLSAQIVEYEIRKYAKVEGPYIQFGEHSWKASSIVLV